MATVEPQVEGQQFNGGPEGETHTMPVLINGLLPGSTTIAIYKQAMDALDGNGFGAFAPLPDIPGAQNKSSNTNPGFLLERRIISNFGNSQTKLKGVLTYRNYNYMIIGIDGNVVGTTTRFDVDGNILSVDYADPTLPADVDGKETDYSEVNVLRPLTILEFQWVDKNPQRFRDYQGRVNKSKWQGGDPHTWKNLSFNSRPLDIYNQCPWYFMQASFQFIGFKGANGIVDTYDPVLIWTRRDSRKPPAGLDPKKDGFPKKKIGNGFKQVKVEFEADFSRLTVLPKVFT